MSDYLEAHGVPYWMKGNNNMNSSSFPCLKPGDQYNSTWALYFSYFLTEFQQQLGITFWGLTIQNEPEANQTFESCLWSPEEERDFVKNFLGPQLRADHPDVKIMIWDHNKDDIVKWAQTILSDPKAAEYIAGTAYHWYSGSQFNNVQTVHDQFPDYFLLATEACNCPGVSLGNWDRGESYGYDIIGDLNVWTIGWVDWNMLLDMQGGPNHVHNYCDAHLIGDASTQTVHFQPSYYYMGQISKFVLPNSQRVSLVTTGNTVGVSSTAVITPDNQVVVVVMNQNNNAVDLVLEDSDQSASYSLPSHAIVTFLYDSF